MSLVGDMPIERVADDAVRDSLPLRRAATPRVWRVRPNVV